MIISSQAVTFIAFTLFTEYKQHILKWLTYWPITQCGDHTNLFRDSNTCVHIFDRSNTHVTFSSKPHFHSAGTYGKFLVMWLELKYFDWTMHKWACLDYLGELFKLWKFCIYQNMFMIFWHCKRNSNTTINKKKPLNNAFLFMSLTKWLISYTNSNTCTCGHKIIDVCWKYRNDTAKSTW